MNRKQWIAVSLIAAVLIIGAAVVFTKRQPQLKSFPLRYLKGPEAADLLGAHLAPGAVEGWSETAVFIRSNPSDLATVQTLLAREDHPKPQLSLRFQIIEADGFATSDTAIAKVESVLRNLFRFKGYRLTAEAYVQARAHSEARQTVAGQDKQYYELAVRVEDIASREGKASAQLSVELNVQGQRVLQTSVNVPTGQTVVLGTARPSAERGAFILVVTPEIK